MSRGLYYKKFSDDREFEVLKRIIELDPEITVSIKDINNEGFYMEFYDELTDEENSDPAIKLQKIKLLVRLHKIDIYHNDLGDHNFLIKDGIVKIIDFNSSFLMTDDEWLEALYENIYNNDSEIIRSKNEAMNFELTGFIESL